MLLLLFGGGGAGAAAVPPPFLANIGAFLVIVQGYNPDTATVDNLFFGTEGLYTVKTIDTPAIYFDPRVEDPGNFERHLSSPDSTRGGATVGAGDVVLKAGAAGGPNSTLDYLLDWSFDGRPIVIKSMASIRDDYETAQTLATLTIDQIVTDDAYNKISFRIHDRLSDLDQPLLDNTFTGTTTAGGMGTANGNTELVGVKKQRVYGGPARFVTPQIANAFDLIDLWSDGPCDAIVVYDGGAALTNAGDTANLAALLAWTQVIGNYKTCLALGMSRRGGAAVYAITADVTEGDTAADRSAAQIVRQMLLDFFGITPGVDLITGAFTPFNATITGGQSDHLGGTSASLLEEDTTADVFHWMEFESAKDLRSLTYEITGLFKAAGRDLTLGITNDAEDAGATVIFNLATGGVIVTNNTWGATFSVSEYEIVASTAGFYRCTVRAISDGDTSVKAFVALNLGDGFDNVYTGDGSSGLVCEDVELTAVSPINEATFTALDAANDAECGILVTGDETVLTAANRVLDSIGAYLVVNRVGVFEVGRIDVPLSDNPCSSSLPCSSSEPCSLG